MSARCWCFNNHNSHSGRCHHNPGAGKDYCEDCVRECGVVEPIIIPADTRGETDSSDEEDLYGPWTEEREYE